MDEEGLISIGVEVFGGNRAVQLVYQPNARYCLKDIIAYVHEVSNGNAREITVYEDEALMHHLRNMAGAGWVSAFATKPGTGL